MLFLVFKLVYILLCWKKQGTGEGSPFCDRTGQGLYEGPSSVSSFTFSAGIRPAIEILVASSVSDQQ